VANTTGAPTASDLGLDVLAMAYARMGRIQDAHATIKTILKASPTANLAAAHLVYLYHRRQVGPDNRINALRNARLPEWPYGFQGSPADQLDGATIRTLAVDKTWAGHQHGGAPLVMQVSANGDRAQRGPQGLIAGKITIQGNLMCMRSGAISVGREFSSPVYRNRGGSKERQHEYVFADIATAWYFSVAPVPSGFERFFGSHSLAGASEKAITVQLPWIFFLISGQCASASARILAAEGSKSSSMPALPPNR
jgi:adenylate cyclase